MKKLVFMASLTCMIMALAAPAQADHERRISRVDHYRLQHGHYPRSYRDDDHHHRHQQHREYYGARYCADRAHYRRPHYHVHPRVYAAYYAAYPVYARDSNLTLILTLPL